MIFLFRILSTKHLIKDLRQDLKHKNRLAKKKKEKASIEKIVKEHIQKLGLAKNDTLEDDEDSDDDEHVRHGHEKRQRQQQQQVNMLPVPILAPLNMANLAGGQVRVHLLCKVANDFN